MGPQQLKHLSVIVSLGFSKRRRRKRSAMPKGFNPLSEEHQVHPAGITQSIAK
jgi:hypothetical protein